MLQNMSAAAPPPPPPPHPHPHLHSQHHPHLDHFHPPPIHHHLFPHHHHHHQLHHPHLLPPPDPPKPRFLFRMPRVVPNQKEKYESDDLMKRHAREGEVRYTGFRDRPMLERQAKFIQSLREGHAEIAFTGTGFNLVLSFDTFTHALQPPERRQIDFEKEPGKVHIRTHFILNGVCVKWRGYLDMERLDGVGIIEFDEETAKLEDVMLKEQVEAYNRRVKEIEEHRKQQQRQLAALMGQHQAAMVAAAAAAAGTSPLEKVQNSNHHHSTTITTSTTGSEGSSSPPSLMKSHHCSAKEEDSLEIKRERDPDDAHLASSNNNNDNNNDSSPKSDPDSP